MIAIGIDPGLTGAVAALEGETVLAAADMPTTEERLRSGRLRRRLDPQELLHLLWGLPDPDMVVIEAVGASPGMGVVSAFSFGHGAGVLEGAVAAIWPTATILRPAPNVWKRGLAVPADKRLSLDRARELLPSGASMWTRVRDHGRAEAAMLALWGIRSARAKEAVA